MAVGEVDTDPGDVLVAGTTGLLASPLVLGAFAGFVDVLVPGGMAEPPPGAEPTLGPGMFWHGGSHGSAAKNGT